MTEAMQDAENSLPKNKWSFDERELAALTGIKAQTFRKWRCTKKGGPSFERHGRRISYPRAAVVKWKAAGMTLIAS